MIVSSVSALSCERLVSVRAREGKLTLISTLQRQSFSTPASVVVTGLVFCVVYVRDPECENDMQYHAELKTLVVSGCEVLWIYLNVFIIKKLLATEMQVK